MQEPCSIFDRSTVWWQERRKTWFSYLETSKKPLILPTFQAAQPKAVVPLPASAATAAPQKGAVPSFLSPLRPLPTPSPLRPARPLPAVPLSAGALPLLGPASQWVAPAEFPSLAGCRRLCVDVETHDEDLTTLGPGSHRGAYIIGLALGTDDRRKWYFPLRHEGGGNLNPVKTKEWAQHELNNFDGELIGANILYDLEMLDADWGIIFSKVRSFHDVLIAEPLIDEWRASYALDAISKIHLGVGKDETHLQAIAATYGWTSNHLIKQNLWKLPAKDVGIYAEGDVDRPLRILPRQLELLEKDNQLHIYDLERRLIPVLLSMRKRGVKVDTSHAEQVYNNLLKERDKWLNELKRLAGPSAEFKAGASLAPELQRRGFTLPRTKPSKLYPNGQPSINDNWLEKNIGDPLVNAIVAGRRVDTLSIYVKNSIIDCIVKDRIYCNFNQLKREREDGGSQGTIARFSSSNPNLQQVAGRTKDADELLAIRGAIGEIIRGCFIPEDDEKWGCDDYSQIEYRMLVNTAIGAGSQAAIDAYNNDPKTDYHKLTAIMAHIDPEDTVKRRRVKNVNFSYVNGAGTGKLAYLLQCSPDEAANFMIEYNSKLPFVKRTYETAIQTAERDGVIKTVYGRKQRFPFWEPLGNFGQRKRPPLPREQALSVYGSRIKRAWAYKAINRYISGSAADLMKKAMVDIYEAGICDTLGAFLLTVHDELDVSISQTAEAAEAFKEMKHIMENCIKIKVPILVESKIGSNWGAL